MKTTFFWRFLVLAFFWGSQSFGQTIQGESYSLQSGNTISTSSAGYLGTGYLDFGANGTWAEYQLTASTAGSYTLAFRYGNGSTGDRQCALSVNGVNIGNLAFSPTGSWTTWKTVNQSVSLNSGMNTIRLTVNTSNGGPNYDQLVATGNTTYNLTVNSGSGDGNYASGALVNIVADAAPSGQVFSIWAGDVAQVANVNSASTTLTMSTTNVTISATYVALPTTNTVQAESYSSQSGVSISTAFSGYRGTGFVDYGGNGTWVQYNLNIATGGDYTIKLRYANGATVNRSCALTLNGIASGVADFAPTGGWTTWNTISCVIPLNSGTNTLRITANTSNGGPNLDEMEIVVGAVPLPAYALTVNGGSGDGNYTSGTVVSIVAEAPPSGQIFSAWTGDVAQVANVNSASTTLTMPSANVALTATYANEPSSGWSLTFFDDFNGTTLDQSKWSYGFGWGCCSSSFQETTRPANTTVSNGTLKILAECDNGFKSGAINSRNKFYQRFGKWEARMKIPNGTTGILPAFWMKMNNDQWPPELDIVEFFGNDTKAAFTVHWNEGGHKQSGTSVTTTDMSTDFHVYGVEWTPISVKWLVDGVVRREITTATHPVFMNQWNNADLNGAYMMLNVHMGASWLGSPSCSNLPLTMEVDWVKVYSDSNTRLATGILKGDNNVLGLRADVFPNPSGESAHLQMISDQAGQAQIQVFSLNGQKMLADQVYLQPQEVVDYRLAIQHLEKGIYLIKVVHARQTMVLKLSVE